MQQLRVGVLLGGKSIEREVSLTSGRTICDHLDHQKYKAIPIFQAVSGKLYVLPWRFLHRGKIKDFEHRLEHEAESISWDDLKKTIDFIYIALHGRFGEDGIVQGVLETLDIPYFGSKILASALGMDKGLQRTFLTQANIATPNSYMLCPDEIASLKQNENQFEHILTSAHLSFPVIVKPTNEGSSLGITCVQSMPELIHAVHHACHITPGKQQPVIIEEYLQGMEFSCIVIEDQESTTFKALPPTEIVIENDSAFFDYQQKYMPGRALKYTPARCSSDVIAKIQQISIQATKALGFCTLARIDGFVLPDKTIVITDPNSFSGKNPSSYAFLQAAEIGMSHTDFINHFITTELNHYKKSHHTALINFHTNEALRGSHMNNKYPKKLRIAVLLGGTSNEREISLESGRNIIYKLSPHTYETTPLFVNKDRKLFILNQRLLVKNATTEIEESLTDDMKISWSSLPEKFDFVFIGLHGGIGENGSVQGMLEMLGLPYNGSSVLTSALCMDKYKTNQFLITKGFSAPQQQLLPRHMWEKNTNIEPSIAYPVIIKPHDDGCSMFVHKAHTADEFIQAVKQIFDTDKESVLIEEYIEGTELTVGVTGNQKPTALPPSQALAATQVLSIEEKFLPGAGENQTPAPLPQATLAFIQKSMEKIYKAVGCKGYARIDCFYQTAEQSSTGAERVVILEINTLPALTPATCLFHQAGEIGLHPMEFIDLIVQLGLEEHGKKAFLSDNPDNVLHKYKKSSQHLHCQTV